MTNGTILGCKLSSCNVAADGRCIENNPLDGCVSILRQTSAANSNAEQSDEAVAIPESQSVSLAKHLKLYLGDELTARSAHSIMCANLTRVVALAGGYECGKTSLITCLYDKFQKAPYGGYFFAGSKTLIGFEKRCFSSRVTSGRSEPITERTQNVDEFRFLHLALRKQQLDTPTQHLLLSDITGEAFNAARKSTDGAEKLALFRRADHFVLMVDGANISSESKHKELQQTKTLVRALVQARIITLKTIVDLVINKWDLILAAPNTNDLQTSVEELRQELEHNYAQNMSRLDFHKIATLPNPEVLDRGYGVDNLLNSWMESSALLREETKNLSENNPFLADQRSFISFRCRDG